MLKELIRALYEIVGAIKGDKEDGGNDNITIVVNPDYVLANFSDGHNEVVSYNQYLQNYQNKVYVNEPYINVGYPLYKNKPNQQALQAGIFPFAFEHLEQVKDKNYVVSDIIEIFVDSEITEDDVYISPYNDMYKQINEEEFVEAINYAFNQIGSFYWYVAAENNYVES